jgi:4-hydroxyphenylpyruvate dioxygenase
MKIEYVHFYVDHSEQWRNWFVQVMGFQTIAVSTDEKTQTYLVQNRNIRFLVSSPRCLDSPVAEYLRHHPPGIADVAFGVKSLASILERTKQAETRIIQPPTHQSFPGGHLKWAQVQCPGGLQHTLIERDGVTPILPFPGVKETPIDPDQQLSYGGIDHLVLNVAAGELKRAVDWYKRVLGFEQRQNFTIQTNRSGLYSQVLVHPDTGIQFPINEPIGANSQIQEFLDVNGGAGIQHLALSLEGITSAIAHLKANKLNFLNVPLTYYEAIQQDFPQIRQLNLEWEAIIQQQILVDCQPQDPQKLTFPLLLQIFTQPIFEQPTFFFEFIERRHAAQGFGEGNFRALFEAIEREQIKRELGNG